MKILQFNLLLNFYFMTAFLVPKFFKNKIVSEVWIKKLIQNGCGKLNVQFFEKLYFL
jgi:hypothetical protein